MNKRFIGTKYELYAKEYLESEGYRIVTSNFRCRIGEIDLIAYDKEYLTFVEVKYRGKNALTPGFTAVDRRKQITIYNVAKYYMLINSITDNIPIRFDVISIDKKENGKCDITLFKNAFP